MRRYKFLDKENVYEALNRLRDAFLAAKDGNDVEEIINGLLTNDEKLKIGRRIIVAEYLKSGMNSRQIQTLLKVGFNTIAYISNQLDQYPQSFELIGKRSEKVEKEYKSKRFRLRGGSTLIYKKREYTGFKRKDVKR